MLRHYTAVVVLIGCLATAPVVGFSSEGEPLQRISNRSLQLGIDTRTGACRELVEVQSGFNQLSPKEKTVALWQLTVRDGETAKTFSADDCGPPQVEAMPGGLRLVWKNAGAASGKTVRVEATVKLDDQDASMSRWGLAVEKPSQVLVERIRFPRVGSLTPRKNEFLAVPKSMGVLLANPRTRLEGSQGRGGRFEWLYPGLSLQCLAYYEDGGPGFYAACDDPQAYVKRFAVWSDPEHQMYCEVIHLPEQGESGGERYELPYPVVLGTFQGDWTTAAELYRVSSAARKFSEGARLHRGLVPAWVQETGLWVWNRGRSPGVLPPASQMQKRVGVPVSVLWHWWHHCAYDAGFPEYLPPREGTDTFLAALEAAHRDGIHALLYMNQRLWGINTASWTAEGAAAFAAKQPDGTIPAEVYNKFTNAPCAPMCMGTAFWRKKYAALAHAALCDLKADGVYMDQACMTAPCYDTSHGHARGYGRYWLDGFGQLTDDIRTRNPKEREPALAGEHCGEAWLSSLDLMLVLDVSQERYSPPNHPWEVIPFFQAVYHADAITFGNYSSLVHPPYEEFWPQEHAPAKQLTLLERRFSRQFYLDQARTFVWGQQPMLANFQASQLDERSEEMDYVTRLAQTRQRARKYLLHGTWLRPPALQVPPCDVEFARVSIYVPLVTSTKSCPSVLTSAWRAPDGNVALVFASIVDNPVQLNVPINVDTYGLRERRCVYRIDETGRRRCGTLDCQNPIQKVELSPRAFCLLECCHE